MPPAWPWACLTPFLAAVTPVSAAPAGRSANVARQQPLVMPVTKVIIPTQALQQSPH